jgi:hypothetical protein
MNKNMFKASLYKQNVIESIKHPDELINLLARINNRPIDFRPFTEKQINKCKAHNFYLGLYTNYTWIDEIVQKRKKFSKAVGTKLWDITFGLDVGITKCPCCQNNMINQRNFEIGHIVSLRKGGSNDLKNLIPLCTECNRSMATTNFHVFKKTLE